MGRRGSLGHIFVGTRSNATQLGFFLRGEILGAQALALHLVHFGGVMGMHMVTTGKAAVCAQGGGAVHFRRNGAGAHRIRNILSRDKAAVIGQLAGLFGDKAFDLAPQIKQSIVIQKLTHFCLSSLCQ